VWQLEEGIEEMLTILHRKADGSEKLFMAENVEQIQIDGHQSVPCHSGKFIAHGVMDSGVPSDYIQFEIEQPFGAVFVMNDKGATVARYTAPPVLTQADSNLVGYATASQAM
jgi:hypothetical protein